MESWFEDEMNDQVVLAGIKVQKANYDAIRPLIRTGDALVWAGDTVLQRGIRVWQKPENSTIGLSHASMVIRPQIFDSWINRVFMIEATGLLGLHPAILSDQLVKEHGRCFHISTTLSAEQRMKIEEAAIIDACSGIKYDFGGCWSEIVARVSTDARKYFCSEYVAKKWMDVGYLPQGPAPRPNDLPVIAPRPCTITEIIMQRSAT